jgi:hypothetical protein
MMKKTITSATSTRRVGPAKGSLIATAFAIGAALALPFSGTLSPVPAAFAQAGHESGHGSGDSHEPEGQQDPKKGGAKGEGTGERGEGDSGTRSVESQVLREDVGPDEEDSDRRGPKYGGGRENPGKPGEAGSKKGDLYGDLYVILRDENGVPILDQYGHVQPIDASGNLIPINEEGDIEEAYLALAQPVEFGRLSVGRSPSKVTDKSYEEALASLNAATAITVDEAGRIVVTIDGVEKTIDSPLENLALYITLMENGYLPGLDLQDGVSLGTLSFLADTTMTNADLLMAASFLAAASDKAGSISLDMVVYMDSILGVDGLVPVVGADGKSYVDFSSVTYDRSDTYTGDVTYLRSNGDGTYTLVTESIMTAVFGGVDYTGTQLDAFAQAADDARAVINFIHENPVPAP